MSEWNVKKKTRMVIVIVREVISREDEGPAGFPMMEILDKESRRHRITAVNMPSYEFERIEPGAQILLTLQESIIRTRVLQNEKGEGVWRF